MTLSSEGRLGYQSGGVLLAQESKLIHELSLLSRIRAVRFGGDSLASELLGLLAFLALLLSLTFADSLSPACHLGGPSGSEPNRRSEPMSPLR